MRQSLFSHSASMTRRIMFRVSAILHHNAHRYFYLSPLSAIRRIHPAGGNLRRLRSKRTDRTRAFDFNENLHDRRGSLMWLRHKRPSIFRKDGLYEYPTLKCPEAASRHRNIFKCDNVAFYPYRNGRSRARRRLARPTGTAFIAPGFSYLERKV